MATELKTVAIVPLNGRNYPTWKVQCRMALVRDGLWGIVNGSETAPSDEEADHLAKFVARRDRALATIVLTVEPSLLYLIGDPEDPVVVWKKLQDQFQKKTWANKLALRRRLHSLQLKDGDSVQDHIKAMIELFNELTIVGDVIDEEDRVVYLLASLPDSFSTLVTALEANEEVPKMEVVTERILHVERKQKEKINFDTSGEKAMTTKQQFNRKGPKCRQCGKFGHIKKNCRSSSSTEADDKRKHKDTKQKANAAEMKHMESNSDSESIGLVVQHAMPSLSGKAAWIVDSNNKSLFMEYESLKTPLKVTLGDGYEVDAIGSGVVILNTVLPNRVSKQCKLHGVLYVPRLSYNLLSVSVATERGKTVSFEKDGCQVLDEGKLVAVANKIGELYYLNCRASRVNSNTAESQGSGESKEDKWHRRFGHLGVRSLQTLSKEKLVSGFDYDSSSEISFCQACVEGKLHKSQFPTTGGKRAKEPLGLVHSDVCGKIETSSLGGGHYFLTFIDDYTRYVWMYILKSKNQVFEKFVEWKALVETSSGRKLKTLRTDNGGEYTSAEFTMYLKKEGVRHEFTVPKTPQQNGVAERMNRTLVEAVRSMLSDAQLPKKFWAEALSTAVYLRNRSPTAAVQGKMPFEAWTKQKPDVGHLKAFGCLCYAHIAKDERQKFDGKAKCCIMLGYGTETKAYRLYDIERQRVFFSRDVVFNESKRGFEKESVSKDSDTEYVQLECSNEDHGESSHKEDEQESPQQETPDVILRRSTRERRMPDYYGNRVTVADTSGDPKSWKEAMTSTDKDKWVVAMEKEMESLHANEVWDLVELPKDRKAVGSKWVYKTKKGANGAIERHKARLVAQGFSQKYGQDYDETFSPVVRFESLRMVIALAVQNGLKLHQMDVTTAFLNGELLEEVYMKQPEGYVVKGKESLVCKLQKSIYGLKQSPRCWNSALDDYLKKMGFVQAAGDPCLYMASEGEMFLIAIYVDDILLAAKTIERLNAVKQALSQKFQVKDMGELHYFLGVRVVQDQKAGSVWIGQQSYTESILKKFGMEDAKNIRTPVDTSTKLIKVNEEDTGVDQQLYQSAVGSLLYLSIATRPDITYAVSNVAKFCAKPTKQHWVAVKRIFRYLKGTQQYGLHYNKSDSNHCVGFSDADWGGDLDDRKSTSGYVFQVGGTAISWRSKKQTCVALSTAEAEYIALASAAQESLWLQQLLADLKKEDLRSVTVYEDNQSAISMAKNPQFHGRTKHIAIKYHFIREQVSSGKLELRYCKTNDMIADMLTKGLSGEQFEKLRLMAGVTPMIEHSESSEKEC